MENMKTPDKTIRSLSAWFHVVNVYMHGSTISASVKTTQIFLKMIKNVCVVIWSVWNLNWIPRSCMYSICMYSVTADYVETCSSIISSRWCSPLLSQPIHQNIAVDNKPVRFKTQMSIMRTVRNLILHVISTRIYLLTLLSWLVSYLSTLTYYTAQQANKIPVISLYYHVSVWLIPSPISITKSHHSYLYPLYRQFFLSFLITNKMNWSLVFNNERPYLMISLNHTFSTM